jgi:conjugal transfer mating pair stabilization protein TraG
VSDYWNSLSGSAPVPGTTLNTPPLPQPTPSSAGGMPMDPNDRDMMIRTIAGEAGNQPPLGQAAVAHVIMNRVADGGYGDGVQGVLNAPVKPGSSYKQFSVWNAPGMQESSSTARSLNPNDPQYASIGSIVDKVYGGLIPDPTNGATHYYAPKSMQGGRPPPWAGPLAKQNSVKIGDQLFLGGSTGPGQSLPSQFSGGAFSG